MSQHRRSETTGEEETSHFKDTEESEVVLRSGRNICDSAADVVSNVQHDAAMLVQVKNTSLHDLLGRR